MIVLVKWIRTMSTTADANIFFSKKFSNLIKVSIFPQDKGKKRNSLLFWTDQFDLVLELFKSLDRKISENLLMKSDFFYSFSEISALTKTFDKIQCSL